jgi:hypothetical protein
MTGKLKEQFEKLKEQFEKLKIQRSKNNLKPKTIKKRNNKNWEALDKKLKSLKDEEIALKLSNLQVKSTVLSFKERQERRKNLREENYDSEEDEEEKLKLAEQIKISKEFWEKYNKQRKQNPFFDLDNDMGSRFGKKQKKDIKGMIKKILLYGGLPTLLVVSLGVLSNKKFGKGKIKKNLKVKVSEKENRFKQVFVKLVKEMILKRNQELDGMKKDSRVNEIELQKRQTRRQIQRDAAMRRQLKINKSPSNPQQSVITPPSKETRLEKIKERQQQKIPSNKIFIKINKGNREWYVEKENNSNYYIKNGNIYNKKGRLSKYVYTEEDGLGLRTNNQIVGFFKTEKLKK